MVASAKALWKFTRELMSLLKDSAPLTILAKSAVLARLV